MTADRVTAVVFRVQTIAIFHINLIYSPTLPMTDIFRFFKKFFIMFLSSPKDMLIDFRERGRERERERERNISVREKHPKPTAQACVLTGN